MNTKEREAIANSINAMDGARRAGWAKAYAANDSLDEALRDLNLARGDLESMTGFAAVCYGFMTVAQPSMAKQWLASEAVALSMLPPKQVRVGRAAARDWLASQQPKREDGVEEWVRRARMWEARAKENKTKAAMWDAAHG